MDIVRRDGSVLSSFNFPKFAGFAAKLGRRYLSIFSIINQAQIA